MHPLKLKNGKVVSQQDEIRDEWMKYFQELYDPKDDASFDNNFKLQVESTLVEMEYQSYFNDDMAMSVPLSHDEVQQVCMYLHKHKAPGWDHITGECLQYGGDYMIKCLTWLFNVMTKFECVPQYFKRGIIIPIPKGLKDKQFQDNYRGITLIPVIAKVYEKCIMKRVEKSRCIIEAIDELQGVTKAKCSSLHVAWLVREVMASHIEQGHTIYIGLLDIKKAYDTVWQNGMFVKLFQYGINGKTWRIIRNFYANFTCQVQCGSLSDVFQAYGKVESGSY